MSNLTTFKLVTKADAAAIFGVCTKTIENYIRDDLLPQPEPFASREYWHPDVFKAFLAQTFKLKAQPASEPFGPAGESSPNQQAFEPKPVSKPLPEGNAKKTDSNPAGRRKGSVQARLRALNTGR